VKFVLLTSRPGSPYADTSRSYEYPARYRRHFEPLMNGEPMLAIIYGPADETSRRMAYIGWAALNAAPVASARRTRTGEPQWEVFYADEIQYFPNPVPSRLLGEPMEKWIRDWPDGAPDMRGRSVRTLESEDATRILELGHAGSLGVDEYPTAPAEPVLIAAERSRRLVEAVQRDARFRRDVTAAYSFTCAITGLNTGSVPRRRATQLLDAAHIRPVGDRGPDVVSNGLALTPTVHRLFDQGLISVKWSGNSLALVRSPRLDSSMVQAPDRGTVISLDDGKELLLPTDPGLWPSRDQVRYHQREVFKGPESLVT
jgi:putative restriction endonuclease